MRLSEVVVRGGGGGEETGERVGESMQELYGFGCRWDFGGSITAEGVYQSSFDEDPDLEPLGRWTSNTGERYDLFVYPYSICAVRDPSTGETKITRMD